MVCICHFFSCTLFLGEFVIVWKKEPETLISAGTIRIIHDKRFVIASEFILEINNLQAKDSGKYSCTVSTQPPMEQIQTIDVQGKGSTRFRKFEKPKCLNLSKYMGQLQESCTVSPPHQNGLVNL